VTRGGARAGEPGLEDLEAILSAPTPALGGPEARGARGAAPPAREVELPPRVHTGAPAPAAAASARSDNGSAAPGPGGAGAGGLGRGALAGAPLGSAGVRRRTAARAAGESGAAQEGVGTAPAVDGEEEGGRGGARDPLTGSARAQAAERRPNAGLPGQPGRGKGGGWAPAALGGVDATTVAAALLGAAAGGAVAGPWGVTAGAP
jgi:hypothetical protein